MSEPSTEVEHLQRDIMRVDVEILRLAYGVRSPENAARRAELASVRRDAMQRAELLRERAASVL